MTSSTVAPHTVAQAGSPNAGPRRWWALAVIAAAQLMVVLDATIVNIALPQAQHALRITDADRQWVVTAYSLAFGGLLLLGGRIADYWGRKRAFVTGIAGFAVASALGGFAQNGEMLFAARALQGAFGALLAPASLALLTVMFTEARERAKAFGVYGAIAGGGAAIGLLAGGVLTQYADAFGLTSPASNWRWCLLVNVPVAVLAIVAAVPLVKESRAHGNTRYDVPGAVLVTLGLVSLVYGFTKASTAGWGAATTWGFVIAAVVLLALFVVVEVRSANPLLPMRIVTNRTRGGAYLASLLTGVGFIGAMLFLTYYLQAVLGYKPIEAGVASLPLTVGVLISAGVATALMPRLGAKPLMSVGSAVAALGMLWLTRIGVDTSYYTHVLPPMFIMGIGLGLVFVPLGNVALTGIGEHDAGAASAVINASQQVGGSLGTALLNTVATTATAAYLTAHHVRDLTDPAQAREATLRGTVHGFVTAFAWGAVTLGVAAVIVLVLIRAGRPRPSDVSPPAHVG